MPKPFDVNEAMHQVERARGSVQARTEGAVSEQERADTPEILGGAPAMQEVFRAIGRLARSTV